MRSHVLILLIALAVIAQPCCCLALLGGPEPPYTITPSDEAIQRLEERMNSTPLGPDGSFSITVTEEEMTSLAARALDQMQEAPPISQPQVHFRNGRVEFYFTVHVAESFTLPGMIAFSMEVKDGKITTTIEEAAVGPIPVPESTLEEITKSLNESLSQGVASDEAEVLISDIQIGDKQMIVSGKVLD